MTPNRVATSPADELQYVAEVLIRDWQLALPTAVASLVVVVVVFLGLLTVVAAAFTGHAAGGGFGTGVGLGSGLLIFSVLFALALAALYVAQGMVVASAPAAFEGLPPNLGIALRVTAARLPQLLVAGAASFALALVPIALSIVLIGVPVLFVLGYLLMYVPAAVIIGNEGGLEAIKTSFRITTTRVGESFICWLGTILALVAGAVANGVAVHIPIVNLVAGFAIGGFTSAYAAMLTVRFYTGLCAGMPADAPLPAQPASPSGGLPTIIR